jgi:hypothetical protein
LLEFSERYITRCIDIGILTKKKIHEYPLRNANLAMVLKAYAVSTHKPYTVDKNFEVLDDHKLYLTDGGFEWLLATFSMHSLQYLRSTFHFVFSNATEDDIDNPKYMGYNNFRGITGDRPKAGTKQKAVLVHTQGKLVKEYRFDTLREARKELLMLSRFYPIDEFTLYRIRKNKGSTYRSEVRTVLPENKRGAVSNLPHLRK